MKKFVFCLILGAAAIFTFFAGCSKETDYNSFISEKRSEIYLYGDDNIDVKVHICERETPYLSDGYCGDMCDVTEIFVKFKESPESVGAELGGQGGEMSYMSVTDSYYLSFTGGELGEAPILCLTYGGGEHNYTLERAKYDGVISIPEALESARQYDGDTFLSLTNGNNFEGEIYVRLIADEGKCYYYVGVTDREGNTYAYLVDGETANVIAERKL